jgi:hypothetical protein
MDDPQDKSAEFRRQAAACIDVAQRMSLLEDRSRMMEMAQRWLELAQKAEVIDEGQGQRQQPGNRAVSTSSQHGHQPALQQQQVQPAEEGGGSRSRPGEDSQE